MSESAEKLEKFEIDISSEAIKTGLASQLSLHYRSNDGGLRTERSPVLDDCYTFLMVFCERESRHIKRLLAVVRHPRDQGGETIRMQPVTSHSIDMKEGTATISGHKKNFYLTIQQYGVIYKSIQEKMAQPRIEFKTDAA